MTQCIAEVEDSALALWEAVISLARIAREQRAVPDDTLVHTLGAANSCSAAVTEQSPSLGSDLDELIDASVG